MNIALEDFKKLEIRIGKIISAEKIENADRLLKLEVDFGSAKQNSGEPIGRRQIVSGIAQWYKPEDLVGKECPFIVNLEPRTFMGVESRGMLFAVKVDPSSGRRSPEGDSGQAAVLLHPDKDVPEGSLLT